MLIYGVNFDKINVTTKGKTFLLDRLKESGLDLMSRGEPTYVDFIRFCEDNRLDISDADAVHVWFENMDYDGFDVGKIFAEVVNFHENWNIKSDAGICGCPLYTPWDIPENMKSLTKKVFLKRMSHYLGFMTDETVCFQFYDSDVD